MERLMERLFKNSGKRAIALMLSLLMVVSMLPLVWPAVNAAYVDCGLEVHTHNDECYDLTCTLHEGEEYGAHAHSEDCYTQTLACECAEDVEHTEDCYAEKLVCILSEGENVLLGQHNHAEGCYILVCEKTEHVHTEACEAATEKSGENSEDDLAPIDENGEDEIFPLADSTTLSVSGVWDVGDSAQGHENIAFGSDDTATIEHGDNYLSEEVTVRVIATYPANATDLKLKIELAEGLEWVSNGESSILASALDSVGSQQGQSKIYGHYLNNGSYTYSFNEGVESVSVTIRVKKPVATNFAAITDSIKVTAICTDNGQSVSATSSLKNLQCEQFSYIGYSNSRLEKTVKAEEVAYNYGFVLDSYDDLHLISHNRLYDYVEMTVTAPKGVKLLSTDVNHSGSGGVADIVTAGWYLVSTDDSSDDVTKYTVRTDGVYNVAIGSTFEWVFPEAFAGQTALVKYSDVRWKVYGDNTVYSLPSNIARESYYNVVSANTVNEIVVGDNISAQFAEDTCSPDAVYKMGGFVIQNKGSDDSVPKVVEYNFDESIGVTNVALAIPEKGTPTVKIWYKVHNDDTWYEKSVTKKMARDATETLLGRIDITNLDLGLSADTYLSALKYEYDYLADDNGTPNDTSDDVRIGIPAGKKTTGFSSSSVNTGGHNPFAGVNLGLSPTNPTAISTVTISDKYDDGTRESLTYTVTTTYSAKPENYMYVIGSETLDKKAGDSFTVSAQIRANWAAQSSQAYSVGFNQYPIIYIRDETGEGISNIRLTNLDGVDIISKYPDNISVTLDHTEIVDHNGDGKFAKVYKIDTTGLSSMPSKEDRYAAAVGFWDSTATMYKLNLYYTVYTPGTYDDGSTVHKLSEAIFLSDPLMSNRSNKSNGSRIDPYDVDGDGNTTGDKDIFQSANQKDVLTAEYTIAPSADISVAASVKKASDDGGYTTWNGSDDYVQIQSGEEYDVRSSIYNGAGVTTSTEDGKKTIVYIPIPKKGDQWGQANSGVDKDGNAITTFAYNMTLSGKVDNPQSDVFTINYGSVDTSGFGADELHGAIGQKIRNSSTAWSSNYSESVNCVQIIVSGMEPSQSIADAVNFILPLVVDESANNREVNIFSAIFYEDITNVNGDNYKMWKGSDRMALQIAEGEVSGRIWIDANGNGLQDSGEVGLANTTVTLLGPESCTTTTDAEGNYSFNKIAIGKYSVKFTPDLDTYALSEKDAGGDNIDSDAVLNGTAAEITGIVIPTTDGLGKQIFAIANLDVGLVPYVDIVYNLYAESEDDMPDGVYAPAGGSVPAGTEYTAETMDEVTGYTFDGWYINGDTSRKFADGTAITENINLVGIWTVNKHTVSYEFVGEIPDGAVAPELDTVSYNTAYTAKSANAVDGFLFDGWYTDDACTAKFADGTAVTDNITLYGKWIYNLITVSGDVKWKEIPDGLTAPAITVELIRNGKVIDIVELQPDDTEYSFENVMRFASAGEEPIEYTVQVRPVANYEASYSTPVADSSGNTTIDITITGTFTYSNLEITNNVTGNAVDTTLKFPFMVEFGSTGSYEYKIISDESVTTFSLREGNDTIRSGNTIELAHGETAIIYSLPSGVDYKVTELDTKGYKMTSTGTEGTIAEEGAKAVFFNEKKTAVKGESDTPDTGDDNGTAIAVFVMQIALLSMLLLVFFMKKRRHEVKENGTEN